VAFRFDDFARENFFYWIFKLVKMAHLAFENQKLSNMNAFRDAMHEAIVSPVWKSEKQAHQQRWNPYSIEGG